MKNEKKEKKPFIKTRTRLDGGKEVEMTKSPSKSLLGRGFAIALAALTILVPLGALIYLLFSL